MLNEVKHLAIAREILRCAQNDIVHHLTSDRAIGASGRFIDEQPACGG